MRVALHETHGNVQLQPCGGCAHGGGGGGRTVTLESLTSAYTRSSARLRIDVSASFTHSTIVARWRCTAPRSVRAQRSSVLSATYLQAWRHYGAAEVFTSGPVSTQPATRQPRDARTAASALLNGV